MVNNICAVSGCGKESYPGCGLSFHRFPKDEKISLEWRKKVPGNVTKCSVICSAHFKPEDFIPGIARKLLKPDAIPSIFPVNDPTPAGCRADTASVVPVDFSDTESFCSDPEAELHTNEDLASENNSHQSISDATEQLHLGIKCNECEGEIRGFRYVCVQCADWDMCGPCEARGLHAVHYVLRVPAPRPQSEVNKILEAIKIQIKELEVNLSAFKQQATEAEIKVEYEEVVREEAYDPLDSVVPQTTIFQNKKISSTSKTRILEIKPLSLKPPRDSPEPELISDDETPELSDIETNFTSVLGNKRKDIKEYGKINIEQSFGKKRKAEQPSTNIGKTGEPKEKPKLRKKM